MGGLAMPAITSTTYVELASLSFTGSVWAAVCHKRSRRLSAYALSFHGVFLPLATRFKPSVFKGAHMGNFKVTHSLFLQVSVLFCIRVSGNTGLIIGFSEIPSYFLRDAYFLSELRAVLHCRH